MPLVFDAPVSSGALTTFVRQIPLDSELSLLAAASTRTVNNNQIDWNEITRRNRTARYRAWDGRIHVSSRDSGESKYVNLLPLSTSINMGEYERLQIEFARTQGTNKGALVDAIYNDAERLTREVQARLEQGIGDLLTDGVLTIDENGLVGFEADFGVPADQIETAGVLWSSPSTALILDDLHAWVDVYVANNGVRPGAIRTSQQVITLMLQNEQIIEASLADLQGLLASEGLPPLVQSYDTQVDVDGELQRVIPANRVLLTPASLSDLVQTVSGVTVTALELVNSAKVDFTFQDAPGIVGVVVKEGPPFRQFTFVDATAMPILTDAKRLMVATVLA